VQHAGRGQRAGGLGAGGAGPRVRRRARRPAGFIECGRALMRSHEMGMGVDVERGWRVI
jgi:hypothetical protein